jgi:hypothetical protein
MSKKLGRKQSLRIEMMVADYQFISYLTSEWELSVRLIQ